MKTKYLLSKRLLIKLAIIAFFPINVFSQDLTGTWTGKVYTTDKTLPYEVVISEKDGKLSGFSYTTFNVKGEEMVAMKSIIVRKEKDNIIIEDQDLVFNSFDEESPKQLKQTNTMQLEVNGKTMILTGKFKTFKTKEFRSMTGGVRLRKDSIIEQPKLIAKLDEMDLSKSLSFLEPPTTADPTEDTTEYIASIQKTETAVIKPGTSSSEIAAPGTIKAPTTTARPTLKPIAVMAKPGTAKPAPAGQPAKPATTTTAPVTAATTPAKKTEPKKSGVAFSNSFGDRKLETIQTVVFKSDSLRFTLYDNGEVDGDTVSVFLNGKPIISKQGLSTTAINKTVYLTPEMGDSLQLVMYAENLGTIAPNTGLLIIKDGRDRYEIRFSGDLKKNAAIILKRKEDNE